MAALLCDRDRSTHSTLRRYAQLEVARVEAQKRPCGAGCEGVHVLLWRTGWRRVDGAPACGQGRASPVTWRPIYSVEVFDDRQRLGLASELARLYPRRREWCRPAEPAALPPEFWPAPPWCNEPLR